MSSTGMIAVAVGALLVFWCIGAHNRLVRLRSAIVQAWAPVDVQLVRCHALAVDIAALLGAPEAQAALGDELGRSAVQTLHAAARQAEAAVGHARTRPASAGAIQSLALAEQVLGGALRQLPLLIDVRAPRLEAAGTLSPLQALLQSQADAQTQLAFVRRVFNEAVAEFNQAIDELPTRLLAGPMGFRPAAALQVAPG